MSNAIETETGGRGRDKDGNRDKGEDRGFPKIALPTSALQSNQAHCSLGGC